MAEKQLTGEEKKAEDKKAAAAPVEAITGSDESIITKTRKALDAEDKVTITIPSTETEKDAVVVSVNGHAYNIPRDKEVDLPRSILEVLKNAKTTSFVQKKREAGEEGYDMVPQESLRIPYQRV